MLGHPNFHVAGWAWKKIATLNGIVGAEYQESVKALIGKLPHPKLGGWAKKELARLNSRVGAEPVAPAPEG
jgi:hypothetical protein